LARPIETLARQIAGAAAGSLSFAADSEVLEFARIAAQAEVDLAHIRRLRATALNALGMAANWQVAAIAQTAKTHRVTTPCGASRCVNAFPNGVASTMPSSEAGRLTDVMRKPLTELLILDRYELRATARRDRALLQIVGRGLLMNIRK
jgi:hypothetical protein